jgi:hypothetical protein
MTRVRLCRCGETIDPPLPVRFARCLRCGQLHQYKRDPNAPPFRRSARRKGKRAAKTPMGWSNL